MSAIRQVSPEILGFLQRTDTCSVSNAIETFEVRTRNEGFIHGATRSLFPQWPPVAGYAVTGRIQTTSPPIKHLCYYHRMDFWEYVASLPSPKIIAIADVDRIPGTGAFMGEMHAVIGRALGCVAYVSNGAVRDLAALESMRFPCFAGGWAVSHAYAHVIDFGAPIEIGGLQISSGDLLQGDGHGVQSVPVAIAEQLPEKVAEIAQREAEIKKLCQLPDFSLEKLAPLIRPKNGLCPPSDSDRGAK